MAKGDIIIDGGSVTVTLNGTAISDITEVAFSIFGTREKINLTTIDAAKWKTALYSDLQKVEDITITKKSDPVNDAALYSVDSQALVITYKKGRSTNQAATFYVQLKDISNSDIEREPGDGVNSELTFYVTNLAALTETGPAITTPT